MPPSQQAGRPPPQQAGRGTVAAMMGRPISGHDDRGPVGDLQLATVVLNVQDMQRAVRFWTAALGYVPREKDWDPEFMMLAAVHLVPAHRRAATRTGAGAPGPVHQRAGSARRTADRARRVRVEDGPYPDGDDFIVLRDPDGNEVCVIDHG